MSDNKKRKSRTAVLLPMLFIGVVILTALTLIGCGKSPDPSPEPEEPHTHTYADEWSSNDTLHWRAATCSHDVTADMAAHTPETIPAVPATETAAGATEWTRCKVCHRVLTEPTVIPPLGHHHTFEDTWSSDAGYHWHAATCSHDVTADMAAHTPETIPAVPATETAGGLTEGSRCSVCGKILVPQKETPRIEGDTHEHTYSRYYTYNDTEHWRAAICEHTDERTDVGAHEYGEWQLVRAASCLTDGEESRRCICGKTETRVIPAVGMHTPVADPATAPTCTENGHTEGSHCSVCGDILVAAETIPAKGHSYTFTVTKQPTKTTTGEQVGICDDCGDRVVEEIPRTNTTETPIHYFGNKKKDEE